MVPWTIGKLTKEGYIMKKSRIFALGTALVMMLSLFPASIPSAAAAEYDTASAVPVTFTDTAVTAPSGSGCEISGTALTVSEPGTYVLSGSCADGSVTVKKGTAGVTLVLNNLTLASANTAPIACNKSTAVTILAPSGTTNTLTDAAYNNDDNYPENEDAENAVIKCKDGSQVTLCGTGTLNISANGKNGIKSGSTTAGEGEAWLTIQDITLNIKAGVNDGINAEQLLTVLSGSITVDAADDGIHSDYTLDVGAEGTPGPAINITNCNEGLEAADLSIYSGNITIHAEDDCLNAANSDLGDYAFTLNIAGGNLTMDTTGGDGIDSNGTLTFTGGTTVVWTASTADNQPLDADGLITISGGTVFAAGGSAGMGYQLSASQPYVTFGASPIGGMGGIDRIPGPQGQPEDRPEMPSGWLPSGQMQTPPDGQPGTPPDGQPEMPFNEPGGTPFNSQAAALAAQGGTISLKDAAGNTLYSTTAVYQMNYAFYSSADLVSGSTYALYSGNTEAATSAAQTGAAGGHPGTPGQRPGASDSRPAQPSDPSSAAFQDVTSSAWYSDAVNYVISNGLMSGTDSSHFTPTGTATRAMVMTVLARHAGQDVSGGSTWYENAMTWSVQQGISDGTDPGASITREQFVTMLWRCAGEPGANAGLTGFADADLVSDWAVPAMEWAVSTGLVTGSGGRLVPSGNTTRAEMAALLMRFCENSAQ